MLLDRLLPDNIYVFKGAGDALHRAKLPALGGKPLETGSGILSINFHARRMNAILSLFSRTLFLDLGWVNYLWGVKPEFAHDQFQYQIIHVGIPAQLVKHVGKTLRSLRWRFQHRGRRAGTPEILFYVNTINQARAVMPVQAKTRNSALWVDVKMEGELFFPSDLAHFFGFLSLPWALFQVVRRGSSMEKWTLRFALTDYLDTYGYYFVGSLWLKKLRPRVIVIASDHSAPNRALMKAAMDLGIRTVYIQHAPVTADFPPLEFDIALLEGAISQERYAVKNQACQIHLVGMARRVCSGDTYRKKAGRESVQKLGVAFNDFDSQETIESLLLEIKRELPEAEIVLRPHPGDWSRFAAFRELAARLGLIFSDPKAQTSWQFLESLDLLVGGNSGILLEAAFLGVIPLQHKFLTKGYDHYGYQNTGVVYPIQSMADVKALKPVQVREGLTAGLQKFDSTFGTEWDGKSAELAAGILERSAFAR